MTPGPCLRGCIYCNHKELWKHGFYNSKASGANPAEKPSQKEANPNTQDTGSQGKPFSSLSCSNRYGLSSYAISEILWKKFSVKISPRTICKWARKFGNIKHLLKHLNIKFGKVWHVDEMFIKAKGRIHYLYAVMDDKSQVIALHISERRDLQSAILCLRKAKHIAGKPEIFVMDGWYAYPRVIRKVFGRRKPRVKHVKAHFRKELVLHNGKIHALSNNRIEGWNSWFRRIYRGMRGFKSLVWFQMFLDIFWVLWNLKSNAWEFLGGL